MTKITYHPMDTAIVTALRAGGPDAYGFPSERAISDGTGMPCRHCLGNIPKGNTMLILAHRPFGALHPYAETGPIFLCADNCAAFCGADLPTILSTDAGYLLKGYTADERICYGTGRVVAPVELPAYAQTLLEREEITFVDIRSASNNCYLARITRH